MLLRFAQDEVMLQQLLRRPIVEPWSAASFLSRYWGAPEGDFNYEVVLDEDLGVVATFESGGMHDELDLMSLQDFMKKANEEFESVKNSFEPEYWYETLDYDDWNDEPKPTEKQLLIEFIKYFTTPGVTASRTAQGPPSLSPRMPKVVDPKMAELLWEIEFMIEETDDNNSGFHITHDTGLGAVAWIWGYDDYYSPNLGPISRLMDEADKFLRTQMTVEKIQENKVHWGKFLLKHNIHLPDLAAPGWFSSDARETEYLEELAEYSDIELRTALAQYFMS